MSKELTPLEALDYLEDIAYGRKMEFNAHELKLLIETELKNYQELLEKPCVLVGRDRGYTKAIIDMISKNYKEIKITNIVDENKVKALEIIKDKRVDVGSFINYFVEHDNPYETYVLYFENPIEIDYVVISEKLLTRGEFVFLKELLK